MPNTLAGINKLSSPDAIVGQTFEVMIESFSKDEGTYIVSRRKYLQTLIPQAIKELKYGEVYDGSVTGTTQFGVFVEFNECLTGMIHKTNINPDWAERIHQISPGFQIQFYIKEIIKDKIILTQILRESLWDTIKVGQTINGKVKDMKPFGALIILDEETNGLVHTSELEKTSRRLTAGEDVKVKVIAVDRMSRKIFLSVA
jgi:ribosomal protein S1